MKKTLLLPVCLAFLFAAFSPLAHSEEPMIKIAVGEARLKKSVVAYPPIQSSNDTEGHLRTIRDVTMEDLAFSGLFDFLNPSAFIEDYSKAGVLPGTFKINDWSSIGAEFVLKGKGVVNASGVSLELYLYATAGGRQLFAKRYKATPDSLRKLGHTISNDVMLALTGKHGPFTSKIAFVSDRTGKKEVYVMDYDGYNPIKVTKNFTHAMAPSWSPDGSKIIFTAITKNNRNVRNHNLFVYELASGKISMLSNKPGINSGAAYSPNGKQLALTMSFIGNPEIFLMNPDNKVAQRITRSYGLDVDPSWSPDGSQIAFVSDRSGRPMLYKMLANGSNVQRLTFAGDYNATPSWSPTGEKIAFAGWDKGKFDVFIMNPDGTNIERLTKDMGNNEDPNFAPDGYFIVYSSNRTGKKNLYITNVDNTAHRRITSDFGNCEAPRWGPSN